jgi:hypothetical protein
VVRLRALKIAHHHEGARFEATTLATWGRAGAVQLLERDDSSRECRRRGYRDATTLVE